MAFPHSTTGSLSPTFVSARLVCLAVKLPSAFALFGRFLSDLREPLGASVTLSERRPSQTAYLRWSTRLLASVLESQQYKGGIPTSTRYKPKPILQSLPPILCMHHRDSISSCSEAPWGLSVQSRVTCIFTGISISPGPSLRQCPNHYAFHAGRNLPDKEFRYLRTVIVTAAVHWGFSSMLRLL